MRAGDLEVRASLFFRVLRLHGIETTTLSFLSLSGLCRVVTRTYIRAYAFVEDKEPAETKAKIVNTNLSQA